MFMDTIESINEIDQLIGEGWFKKIIGENEEAKKLTLEEQITWVKNCSIHGQTSFFRYNDLFPILENIAIPSFNKQPIKIASVGCSDGREVYSILINFWKIKDKIVLHGYDSNQELIKEAISGGLEKAVNSKGNRLDSIYYLTYNELNKWKHFGAEGIAYIVNPRIGDYSWADLTFTKLARKKINFGVHDITKNMLPERHDIVVLLNLLCHYAIKGREIILENVRNSLTGNGWLICEGYNHGSANAAEEYDGFMKDLSEFGFIKQTTIIPTWFNQNDDISCWSRVYKKDN